MVIALTQLHRLTLHLPFQYNYTILYNVSEHDVCNTSAILFSVNKR